ncbi:hypothetical protein PQ472_00740 [Lacticaseibacillus pabuli]|uniref:RNA polymerase sigma-54 factor n=1 Tax=Lacticaseibacillus pabuli TaxID=3025672 RepID=A0ABY7WRJ1_9LACO|nr:hypothetical protein [Lacticaseibacillus sp. KACC 23028]WDF82800.1 hypothetical protein PQ472_00740 [Lacticaseibacillus sp. KACC 23028]
MAVRLQENGVQTARFKDVNAIMQAPPLALTKGLHDMALDNPFLQVTDPAIMRTGAVDMDEDWMSPDGDASQTLDDYLLEQIHLEFRDVPLRAVLISLVSYLDQDGYLRVPLTDVEVELGCSHQMAEDALAILQTLNPTGVGARDLRECLTLQLDAAKEDVALARRIVTHGLKMVASNDIRSLCEEFQANPDEVLGAINQIKRLSPAPGSYYSQPAPRSTVPEIEIALDDQGKAHASVLREARVRISFDADYYNELIQRRDGNLRRFLVLQRRDYDWLDYSLKKRYEILEDLGNYIAKRQAYYFENGGKLQPLLVRDAVSATHLTAGIVNRAINGHYLQWHGKSYELRHFFSYRAN